ncbi:MAG: TolC family protein, partial [Planctomycetota bacterium]
MTRRGAGVRPVPALLLTVGLALPGCLGPVGMTAENAFPAFENPVTPGEVDALAPAQRPEKPAVPETGPVKLAVVEAVLVGLENNRALRVERKNPAISRTFEEEEKAVFDPVLAAEVSAGYQRGRTVAGADTSTTAVGGGAAVSRRLPTGADLELGLTADQVRNGGDLNAVRGGVSVGQALLRGYGRAVNLADLRQAQLDTLLSRYELRGLAEALAAEIESTCWDYHLAKRQIEIYEKSLELAQKQLQETEERVKVGRLAETELAAARAEVALRQEALINARSEYETTRLRLLRLINPPGARLWDRELVLTATPMIPQTKPDDPEDHTRLAMKMRPDLNEARLRVRRDDLELVKTKNGLLPRLDLFVSLGKT